MEDNNEPMTKGEFRGWIRNDFHSLICVVGKVARKQAWILGVLTVLISLVVALLVKLW